MKPIALDGPMDLDGLNGRNGPNALLLVYDIYPHMLFCFGGGLTPGPTEQSSFGLPNNNSFMVEDSSGINIHGVVDISNNL